MTKWKIEQWLTDALLENLATSDYWNDEEVAASENGNFVDGDFTRLELHLESIGLKSDLDKCVRVLDAQFSRRVSGIGIDLAAGYLWAAPYLLRIPNVHQLFALEFSRHRLLKLGPALLDHYQVISLSRLCCWKTRPAL